MAPDEEHDTVRIQDGAPSQLSEGNRYPAGTVADASADPKTSLAQRDAYDSTAEPGEQRRYNFGASRVYLVARSGSGKRSSFARMLYKLFFGITYFLCATVYMITYFRKFDNSSSLGPLAWARKNLSLAFVRDYLLILVGYVALSWVLRLVMGKRP